MTQDAIAFDGFEIGVDLDRWPAKILRALLRRHYEKHELRLVARLLKPGDRVKLTHDVKVGFRSWQTETEGTVVRTDRRRRNSCPTTIRTRTTTNNNSKPSILTKTTSDTNNRRSPRT